MQQSELMTGAEVSKMLKLSRITLYRYRNVGLLRSVQINRTTIRYYRADVDAMLQSKIVDNSKVVRECA